MWWLILEAGAAFFIFVFIVWWTMFSGRKPERTSQSKDRTNENGRDEA